MPGTRPTEARRRERRRKAARECAHAASVRSVTRHFDEFAMTVNRMTNRQRHQWAMAGWPGLRHREIEPLMVFLDV